MLNLPPEIMPVLGMFAPVFSERVWDWVQVLVMGAILSPGKRTVASALRVMGLSDEAQFQTYHRVLNRAVWSALEVSQILLGRLVAAFVPPDAPLIVGADETLERRKGEKIVDKGVYRDAARSSKQVNEANGKRCKSSVRWMMQMIVQVRCWLREQEIVLMVDGGLVSLELGGRCEQYGVTLVGTLNVNVRLFDRPGPQPPGKRGRKPRKGARQLAPGKRGDDLNTRWQPVEMPWYGGEKRQMEFSSSQSLWHTPRVS